jgi:hypothetical protein
MSYSYSSNELQQNTNSANVSNRGSRLENYVEASYVTDNGQQQYNQISGSYSASLQPSIYANSNVIHQDLPSSFSSTYNQQQQQHHQQEPSTYLSAIEAAILRSTVPIDLQPSDADEIINVGGHRGIWLNKNEVENWRGSMPISAYAINEDATPEIITKRTQQNLTYIQGEKC